MHSPVKRRILANLKDGDDVLVTYRTEGGDTYSVSGILRKNGRGGLSLDPHSRVIRDAEGKAPSQIAWVEIIEAAP